MNPLSSTIRLGSSLLLGALLPCLLWHLSGLPSSAQSQPPTSVDSSPQPTKEKPYATLDQFGWSEDGSLVLAVRIHASSKQELALGKSESQPFTLQDSYLMEKHSPDKILPLPQPPRKPMYGPSATLANLMPNGWMQLGIAFPRPPDPPKDKQGKQPDFILELHLPHGIQSVTFTVPYTEAKASVAPKTPASP